MTGSFLRCAAALLLAAPGAAAAQPQPKPLELPAGKPFEHRAAGLALPLALPDLPRSRGIEIEGDELDVAIEYANPEVSEAVTLYVFRNVAGGVPVWFDRARQAIEKRDIYGAERLDRETAFVPPGQTNASGLMATYQLTDGPFRSTGVALLPVGEWMVKVRASSRTMSPTQIEGRIRAALAAVRWPSAIPAAPAAALVVPCRTALALSGDAAPAAGDTGGAALMDALLSLPQSHSVDTAAQARPPVRQWCRDAAVAGSGTVYRADERGDAYFLALSDAGRGAEVGPSVGQGFVNPAKPDKKDRPSWTVRLMLLSRTLTSTPFDRLPPPQQALGVVQAGNFASAVPTWGPDKGKITINSDIVR